MRGSVFHRKYQYRCYFTTKAPIVNRKFSHSADNSTACRMKDIAGTGLGSFAVKRICGVRGSEIGTPSVS